MSELLGEKQEPEGNRQGRTTRVILAIIVTVMLSGILSWVFVPSVRVLGYQTILMVGPVDARKWSVKKLGGYKALAVRPLVMALNDKNSYVRLVAADALGLIGPKAEKAVPALIEALKDENSGVRWRAAEALGKIGSKAIPALIEALNDKEWQVREGAAEALGKIGKEAVPALIEALKDKDEYIRRYAAIALGQIGRNAGPRYAGPRNADMPDQGPTKAEKAVRQSAVTALIQALKDKNSDVRINAAFALWQITSKTEKTVPILIQALKYKGSVGYYAAEALRKIGPKAEKAIPALIEALKGKDEIVRIAAKKALKKIQKK